MVRVAIASAALSGTSWCPAAANADVAATFDGHTVTEGRSMQRSKEINEAFQPQQPYTADNALSALIRAPHLIDYAIKQGKPQTESAARAAISIHDPPSRRCESSSRPP